MAKYRKTNIIIGAWAKASQLTNGITAKIVSETKPQPSQFLNKDGTPKMQDVAKILFQGFSEVLNISLNRTTINGLIDAFGEDSAQWQNKTLTVETEKVRVGGKAVVALYLIPEGYHKIDDENGYAIIVAKGSLTQKEDDIPIIEKGMIDQDDLESKNIPF